MGASADATICAIATACGEGGIGIVRVSGMDAVAIAAQCVSLAKGRQLATVESHRLYAADVVVAEVDAGKGSMAVDQALVVVMRGPRSYTGEDIVEIHCHGGGLVLRAVCAELVRKGAKPAEPGEFTKRAFLNGRLDLAQAEAVVDTIRARTADALRVAQAQLRGALGDQTRILRERLIGLLAHVEAGIDFVEEDISFIQRGELAGALDETMRKVEQLLSGGRKGRILRDGLLTAIVGCPNVGKSSLLNALLEVDRAIVTPIPGTTRDILEEGLNVHGIPVRLLDTAGMRVSEDPVEQEGMRRTQRAIDDADLLLTVVDGSRALTGADLDILRGGTGKRQIIVVNKADLEQVWRAEELRAGQVLSDEVPVIAVSAKLGHGIDELREAIRGVCWGPRGERPEDVVVTRLRHQEALERAWEGLRNSRASVEGGASGELIAVDLREAAEALGEITGEVCTEDILDRIFREFCIGK